MRRSSHSACACGEAEQSSRGFRWASGSCNQSYADDSDDALTPSSDAMRASDAPPQGDARSMWAREDAGRARRAGGANEPT